MALIPQKTNAESQSLTPTAMLNLFILDMAPIGVNTQFFFVDMTNSNYQPVVFNGTTYIPFPIIMKDFGYDGQGGITRPKVSVSNINGFVSNLLLQNQDLVGATISLIRVFARFIDAVNFPNGVSPYTPDPSAAYDPEIYYINRKTEETQVSVSWELATAFELDSRKLPSRTCLAQFCQWRYREVGTCGYAGAPVSDINNNLFSGPPYNLAVLTPQGLWSSTTAYAPGDWVSIFSTNQALLGVPQVYVCLVGNLNVSPFLAGNTTWVQDACAHTLLPCRARFPGTAVLPFGGFIGLTTNPYIAGYSTQNT